jgi:orotidine-5'-phosphate decarboxylase
MDALQEKIRQKKNPTVAGLDPKLDYIPQFIQEEAFGKYGKTLKGAAEAYRLFCRGLIDALYEVVPAVKPQSAYFEVLGSAGIEALEDVVAYAKEKGLYVIMDAKRGDIGSTCEAYAQAYLGGISLDGENVLSPFDCDCMTVNGYLGTDGIKPFTALCKERDKAIFLLVKTSNPSSRELQDLIAGDRLVHIAMADLAVRLTEKEKLVGKSGWSQIGAVVGATHPEDLKNLRAKYPQIFFLVPGYGAQGGKAQDVQYAFDRLGHGAIVNSSRGIMCAWKKTEDETGRNYQEAAKKEAIRMRDDICRYVTIL